MDSEKKIRSRYLEVKITGDLGENELEVHGIYDIAARISIENRGTSEKAKDLVDVIFKAKSTGEFIIGDKLGMKRKISTGRTQSQKTRSQIEGYYVKLIKDAGVEFDDDKQELFYDQVQKWIRDNIAFIVDKSGVKV